MRISRYISLRRILTLLIAATFFSACVELSPLREETFTFTPTMAASIFGDKQSETFGVCDLSLDRRGTRLYLWDEFIRQRNSVTPDYDVDHLAGYEVGISRGESCHLRILDTYQAAAWFDLSTLPSTAVTSAELTISHGFTPHDAPWGRGTSEQCNVMLIGQATETWVSGIYHIDPVTGAGAGFRPFILWTPAHIDTGPYSTRGTRTLHLDVTHTVSEWVRGIRTNNGFVITPDMGRVADIYRDTEERGFMCDLAITGLELTVTVAVPDR